MRGATHLKNFPTGSAVAQTIALGVGVVLPATLLLLSFLEGRQQDVTSGNQPSGIKSLRRVVGPGVSWIVLPKVGGDARG